AWERVRRFVRRHRAVLSLALASVVVIVVVTALSFAEIRAQRDAAEDARDRARLAGHEAQLARAEAERRADHLSLQQARLLLDEDPLEAMRLLHGVSPAADWQRTRQIAAELIERGFPRALRGHRAGISRIAFSPDGAFFATTSDDCTVRVWDMSSWTSRAFWGHTGEVWRVAWSPDQRRLATTSRDGSVPIWDVASGEALQVFAHGTGVRNVIFSLDGGSVYSADDDQRLRRWDLATGDAELIDRCHSNNIAWSASAVGCVDIDRNEALVYDLRTGERSVIPAGPAVQLQPAGGLSPDGRWFAVNTVAGGVWVWDRRLDRGRALPLDLVPGEGGAMKGREIRFAPASDRLAAPAALRYLRHYDLVRERGALLAAHEGYTRRASFSPDGTRIVSVGGDNRVNILDLAAGTAIALKTPAYMIDAQFSPDGRHVVAAGNDPRVLVWTRESFTRETWAPPEPIIPGALAVAMDVRRALVGTERGVHVVDLERMESERLPSAPPSV
ncbi:MAG TPA: hypothetical protein VIK91_15230, partial [Nannocystis sp.]